MLFFAAWDVLCVEILGLASFVIPVGSRRTYEASNSGRAGIQVGDCGEHHSPAGVLEATWNHVRPSGLHIFQAIWHTPKLTFSYIHPRLKKIKSTISTDDVDTWMFIYRDFPCFIWHWWPLLEALLEIKLIKFQHLWDF